MRHDLDCRRLFGDHQYKTYHRVRYPEMPDRLVCDRHLQNYLGTGFIVVSAFTDYCFEALQ